VSGSWVVVQKAEEVDRALELKSARSGTLSYLAVSAAAYFAFRERSVPCLGTHEFASRESTNEVASEGFGELRSLVLQLDDEIHERLPDMPKGFKPFEAFEHEYNKFVASASFAQMELREFVRQESPSELLYWDNSQELDRRSKQTLTSRLLDQQDWWAAIGVETRRIPGHPSALVPAGSRSWRSRLREFLNPNRTDGVNFLGWSLSRALFRGDRPRILVVGRSDNLISFTKYAIAKHSAQVDWWDHEPYAPVHMPTLGSIKLNGASYGATGELGLLDVLEDAIVRSKTHPSWGRDLDLQPVGNIVHKRLLDFGKRVPRLLTTYGKSMDYFRSRRPSAIICGTADADLVQVVRQAAQASGIPMASFQHGGAYGYMHSEWMKLSDLRADLYVGYGSSGAVYLEGFAQSRGLPAKTVGIGWSHGTTAAQASLKPATFREGERRVIMYAPTGLGGEIRYGPDHGYHDTEYCLEQVRVIEALRRVPDAVVLIKLHPKDKAANPIERWVRQLDDDRVRVLVGGRLPKALGQSDLVVLDCPTTTLIEVMANASRLVYLDLGIMKWTPEGESLMRKSAPWVDVTPGWESRLGKAVLEALEKTAIKPHDNRFLDAYASLDFRPELVWDELQDIQKSWAHESN
jgi:hypothetical protein